jgi:hypothetical protein
MGGSCFSKFYKVTYIVRLIFLIVVFQLKCNQTIWNFHHNLFLLSPSHTQSFRPKFKFSFFSYSLSIGNSRGSLPDHEKNENSNFGVKLFVCEGLDKNRLWWKFQIVWLHFNWNRAIRKIRRTIYVCYPIKILKNNSFPFFTDMFK